MDAQMRNAIYGYVAESDKQAKAAYMREFVMPGMAQLLHRPAYDFTRPYAFNRSRQAFGCYHCHRVKLKLTFAMRYRPKGRSRQIGQLVLW